jgi:peptidyl-prolyl cis-trans isomerase C
MRSIGALAVVVALWGCEKPGTATVDFKRVKPAAGGTWVAKFGGDEITDAELKVRFAEMNPYARARFQTVENRREYLDGLARFEMLAQEATRRGLAQDPQVVELTKRAMVDALLRKELEEKVEAISDAAVAAYYEAHKTDYVKPMMTRLAHVFFTADHKAKAEEALKRAAALPPMDIAAFGKLARELSEDPRSKELEGDLRYLSDEELGKAYGPEVVAAAAELKNVGDITKALVQTEKGFHILLLQARQPALNLSVEQAKPSIQSLLLAESRQERTRALFEKMRKQSGYEVNDAALAAIVVDPKAPTVDSKTPQPGFIPAPTGPLPLK